MQVAVERRHAIDHIAAAHLAPRRAHAIAAPSRVTDTRRRILEQPRARLLPPWPRSSAHSAADACERRWDRRTTGNSAAQFTSARVSATSRNCSLLAISRADIASTAGLLLRGIVIADAAQPALAHLDRRIALGNLAAHDIPCRSATAGKAPRPPRARPAPRCRPCPRQSHWTRIRRCAPRPPRRCAWPPAAPRETPRRASSSAVVSPASPPPMTQTSASACPSSGGRGAPRLGGGLIPGQCQSYSRRSCPIPKPGSCPRPMPSAMERPCASHQAKISANWPQKAVTIFGMSGVGKTTLAQPAAGSRLVPLFRRLPHRHPLHGRAHRRQFQARGDARALPARSAAVGLDPHQLQHHLREPEAAVDLSRQARQSGQGRHPLCRIQAPPAPAPRGRDRSAPRCARPSSARRATSISTAISSAIPAAACARWSIPPNPLDPVLELPVAEQPAALYRRHARAHPHAGRALPQAPQADVLPAAVPRDEMGRVQGAEQHPQR